MSSSLLIFITLSLHEMSEKCITRLHQLNKWVVVFLFEQRAFDMLGFSAEETLSTFQVASSVLKLGNIQFLPRANMDGTESCSLVNEYGKKPPVH
ncbi:hypothetical protein AVEN_211039-1 [Araneus ventricosus]|uniref:Uncharacterized protein n=1 Tax=Araneus ventricosus TaxID=182803 RepID=A0A4Y2SEG8_ARAVE|nr:hypothetical protein AVEN_158681-1 [Araneus ventricosus]GBN85690.1 hypothetical protein AVEN_211039-1 [Araneus ventricosus]